MEIKTRTLVASTIDATNDKHEPVAESAQTSQASSSPDVHDAEQSHLKAEAQPFLPKMASLNLQADDAQQEKPSVTLANTAAVRTQIVTTVASDVSVPVSGRGTLALVGKPFTSDLTIDWDTTRFIAVHNLPSQLWPIDRLDTWLATEPFFKRLVSYNAWLAANGSVSLVCWFKDLRHPELARGFFKKAAPDCELSPISTIVYFGLDPESEQANAISAYDGQVEFIVSPADGCRRNNDWAALFETTRQHAASLGDLRSFTFNGLRNELQASFRAEYYSIKEAREIISDPHRQHVIAPSYIATIQDYLPPGYSRYAVKPERVTMMRHAAGVLGKSPMSAYRLAPTGPCMWLSQTILDPAAKPLFNPIYVSRPAVDRVPRTTPRHSRPAHFHQSLDYHRSGGPPPSMRHNLHTTNSVSTTPRTPAGIGGPYYRQPSPFSSALALGSPSGRRTASANPAQTVDIRKIERGQDVRTTLMIRNVPNRLNCNDLKEILDETNFGQYDFSYLRTDFGNNCDVGYAFVNFTQPEHILTFVDARVGSLWPRSNSDKILEVSYATIQGQDCLIQKFRNSSVMHEFADFRPKLWYSYDGDELPAGKAVGQEMSFPLPDNLSKLSRSLDNAHAVGLYPPRGSRGNGNSGDRRRHGQYDRGTPYALFEERLTSDVSTPRSHALGTPHAERVPYELATPRALRGGPQPATGAASRLLGRCAPYDPYV